MSPARHQNGYPQTQVLYHVSPARNRMSIKRTGLIPQNIEFLNVQREPAIHFMETLEQARDWGFFFMLDKGEQIDIWKVAVQDTILTPDSSFEMQKDYDAWVTREPVAPESLELVYTQSVLTSTRYAPPLAKKVERTLA